MEYDNCVSIFLESLPAISNNEIALKVGFEDSLVLVSISISLKLVRFSFAHDSTAESPYENAWFRAEFLT